MPIPRGYKPKVFDSKGPISYDLALLFTFHRLIRILVAGVQAAFQSRKPYNKLHTDWCVTLQAKQASPVLLK